MTHAPVSSTRPGAKPLTFASYNIHKGVGLDLRRDPRRIVSVISEIAPDAIALQEADRRFGNRPGVLDLDEIRDRTGLEPVPIASRLGELAHGWHGNLVLLRDAMIEDVRPITLPGLEPRGALMVDMQLSGQPLRLIAAHLGLLRNSRLLQAQMLADLQKEGDGRPTILMGDLNEWRRGDRCSLLPLTSFYGQEAQRVASYPARRPMLALDRIFTCQNAKILDLSPHETPLSRIASDHLPIKARIQLGRDTIFAS